MLDGSDGSSIVWICNLSDRVVFCYQKMGSEKMGLRKPIKILQEKRI